jgi:hypothetical protein
MRHRPPPGRERGRDARLACPLARPRLSLPPQAYQTLVMPPSPAARRFSNFTPRRAWTGNCVKRVDARCTRRGRRGRGAAPILRRWGYGGAAPSTPPARVNRVDAPALDRRPPIAAACVKRVDSTIVAIGPRTYGDEAIIWTVVDRDHLRACVQRVDAGMFDVKQQNGCIGGVDRPLRGRQSRCNVGYGGGGGADRSDVRRTRERGAPPPIAPLLGAACPDTVGRSARRHRA